MEIILLKNIDSLGRKFDVVKVKDGYGRNYLIPKKMGIIANVTNMAKLNNLKKQEEARLEKMLDQFKEYAAKLNETTLTIPVKAGASGKIFGSVTPLQIVQVVREHIDYDVDKNWIELEEEIKNLGSYQGKLKFHKEVVANLNIDVVEA